MPKTKGNKIYLARVAFAEEIIATDKKDALNLFREYLDTYQGDIIEDHLEIGELKSK